MDVDSVTGHLILCGQSIKSPYKSTSESGLSADASLAVSNNSGRVLWNRVISIKNKDFDEYCSKVILSSDKIAVYGLLNVETFSLKRQAMVARLSYSDGLILWTKALGGSGNEVAFTAAYMED